MANKFLEIAFTDAVSKAQEHYYGRSQRMPGGAERDALTDDEAQFIQSRDSFYLATVSETGWPYVQHRGGQPGFLRVVSPTALAFADYGSPAPLPEVGAAGGARLVSAGGCAILPPCLFWFTSLCSTRRGGDGDDVRERRA